MTKIRECRTPNTSGRLNRRNRAYAAPVLCLMTAIALPAQTLTTLYNFCSQSGCTDGNNNTPNPLEAALVQGADGNFYGTTPLGGAAGACTNTNGCGTVFKITPTGALTTLHSFCSNTNCTDGSTPLAGLTQAPNGNFYGTTNAGGASGHGTVFQITPSGTLTTLYSFCSKTNCTDGASPYAGLTLFGAYLYGTTVSGGANGAGTVFRTQPKTGAKPETLYSFCSQTNCADGKAPYAALTATPNGVGLLGTTSEGGANQAGTIFKLGNRFSAETLYSFCSQSNCTDGQGPYATLVFDANGNLWGTTPAGGANRAGTVFELVDTNDLLTIYSFCGAGTCADGNEPYQGLVLGSDGNLYGTSAAGGAPGLNGNIFEVTPAGALSNVYTFCTVLPCTAGSAPAAPLIQGTDGNFYGTTKAGGKNFGTVFSLSVGLGRFVKTQPTFGVVGATVDILGTDLTGASSVTFNGTAAVFKVVSSSEITTTVPSPTFALGGCGRG